MSIGIRCLLAPTAEAALVLAAELDRLNRERRELEASVEAEALAEVEAEALASATPAAHALCLYRPGWHQGVVGIVAGRLKDRYRRPTLVFARGADGMLRGSGRSIAGFHLRDALDLVAKRAPGMLVRFGGHAFAAGLTLAEADLPRFAAMFETVARETLSPAALAGTIETDGGLARGELCLDLAAALRGEVWGQGFPWPLFDDTFRVAEQRIVGERHSKLALARDGERFDAIVFRHADPLPPSIHAAYRPEVNVWNGATSLQLVIEHWVPA